MVGTVADAEDLVQDVFVQMQTVDWSVVQNAKAYLCKVTAHRALDLLKSHKRKREVYVGPWLPEPYVTCADGNDPFNTVEQDETLSFAFMALLDQLNPVERAVFVLREAFSFDYHEIADILGKSEVACRKIMSRAKTKLQVSETMSYHNTERSRTYVQTFVHAAKTGSLEEFLRLLAIDVVLYSDGGGRVRAALRPIYSRDHVVQFMMGLFKKAIHHGVSFDVTSVSVNGEHGVALLVQGALFGILSFHIQNEEIQSLFLVRNPEKLERAAERLGVPVFDEQE
jgi:RNA polymerase sigma-70 factor (ECF subfamily)